MSMVRFIFLFVEIIGCCILSPSLFSETPVRKEELVLTTYYPVPYGDYRELRSRRMALGEKYSLTSDICWEGPCNQTIDPRVSLLVERNIGVGTTTPQIDAPNHLEGNLDVNDIYVRNASGGPKWLSQIRTGFGDWSEPLEVNTVYRANTDGFVVAEIFAGWGWYTQHPWGCIAGYTGTDNPPTARRGVACDANVINIDYHTPNSFTMPVKKGHYWYVWLDPSAYISEWRVYWMPFGQE